MSVSEKPLWPQSQALGMKVLSAGEGRATFVLPYREDLVGDPETGVIAGGAVTTLLDSTCGLAVMIAVGPRSTATLDLRIDYMRRAQPGRDIVAEAHVYKMTRTIAFVRATAHDGDPDDPVAAAQAAFMLDSDGGRKPGDNLKSGAR